jgi:anti-sigma regulatory factor (Ser/Thr protein kinase)
MAPQPPHRLSLRFDANPMTIRAARRFVADFVRTMGGSDETAIHLEVVTGEILTNSYEHAYQGETGPLQIDLSCDGIQVDMTVHDDGEPIIEPPKIPTVTPGLGSHRQRGLFIIGQLADKAEVLHRDGARGVGVHVVKFLSPKNP